jgi:hypothetical protein
MKTAMTPEATLGALRQARAARKDELDISARTQREFDQYVADTATIDTHILGVRAELDFIASRETRRAPLQAGLDRLLSVESAIEQQITDAPDWRTLAEGRARDAEWGRQQALAASKVALHRGVEVINGQPVLPGPLGAFLTDTCATCGHAKVHWPGTIDELQQEIAALDKTIAERQVYLGSHLRGAEAVLGALGMR